MNDYITGKLILAGDYSEDEQLDPLKPLARVIVVMEKDVLAAVKSLPLYREVALVPVEELLKLKSDLASEIVARNGWCDRRKAAEVERDQARAKCGELVTESNRLRAEIERWRDSNNRLREEMERQSRRADEATAERDVALNSCNAEELRQVRAEVARWQVIASKHKAELATLQAKWDALPHVIVSEENEIAKLERDLAAARQEIVLLKRGLHELQRASDTELQLAAAREAKEKT